jgi:cation diffusion facilitator family transporter
MAKSGSSSVETNALRLSLVGYLFMAALGITFAVLSSSEAILLDGTYSLISFVMTLLAQGVTRLVGEKSTPRFHFGFAHFEPLLNFVRGLLILGICGFALFSAVTALLGGGRSITPGLAVFYGIGSAAICMVLSFTQRAFARRADSPILVVDARNWLVDGLLSLAAATGFVFAYLIQGTSWAPALPYVDPVVVTVLVLLMFRIPLRTVRENFRQVLLVAPVREEQEDIRRRVAEGLGELRVAKTVTHMVEVGRFGYLLIHVVLPEEAASTGVGDLDAVRARIEKALEGVHPRLVIDVVFTTEERFAGDVPVD